MSALLQPLEVEDSWRLAPVLARCPRCRIASGRRLGRTDLDGAVFLVVESGVVVVTAESASGDPRRMTLAIAVGGDVLVPPGSGEELAALGDIVLTLLTPPAYRALLASPAAAAALVERLAAAVVDRQESIATFASVEHVDRVREKLLQLARSHGRATSEGVQLDLPLTHQLIAQTTASARETVTWAIAELRREGFLVRDGRRYLLTVPPDTLQPAV